MKNTIFFLFLTLTLLLNSCDRKGCKNKNPVFNQYSYSDNEYKIELAKQIEIIGLSNLRTWLSDYVENDGETYLVFYIQNNSLCAEVMVKMIHWTNLEYLKDRKGKGRFNAEFVNLDFTTEKTSGGNIEFIYQNFSHIRD